MNEDDEIKIKVTAEPDFGQLDKKLDEVPKQAAKTGKVAGDAMGAAAGKSFSEKLRKDADSAFKNIESKGTEAGSKLSGVFGKIGLAVAAAFTIDKVVTFFKSAVSEAEKAEKATGKVGSGAADGFKKAEADIDKSIEKIKQLIGAPLLAIVRTLYDALATVLSGISKVVNALSEAFTPKTTDKIIDGYKKTKSEIIETGKELDRLSAINKRTAEEEIQLTKLKAQLSDGVKALGLNYNVLAGSAKSYLDIAKQQAAVERQIARGKVGELAQGLSGGVSVRANELSELQGLKSDAIKRGDREAIQQLNFQISEKKLEIRNQKEAALKARDAFLNFDKLAAQEDAKIAMPATGGRGTDAQEARFLDARLRLVTIEANQEYTIRKAIRETSEGEERERRIDNAHTEAEQAARFEIGILKQVYAEFIEDKHTAETEALKLQKDNAIRASEERLEFELRMAHDNEDEIEEAKEKNVKRLEKIRQAAAIKQATIEANSFAQTLQAANATTTGLANLTKARDIGGSLSGIGGLATGLSGFKSLAPALGVLGPAGQIVGAVGGITSTLSSLFGKSDEQRQREAEEAQRQRDAQLQILELQANYQKSMLALQEAAAKLPFEDLQRNLRLIDISAQAKRLSGGDETTIEAERQASRQAALQGTLTSQSGTISGGQLFSGTTATAEELTKFLNERAAQSLAVQQFVAGFSAFNSPLDPTVANSIIANLQTYKGKIPDEIYSVFENFVSERSRISAQIRDRISNRGAGPAYIQDLLNEGAAITSGAVSGVGALGSEVVSDTTIAENLLSVIEQSNQTQLDIAKNTKTTADALTLQNQRENMFIDVAGGGLRGFGQFLSGMPVNTGALSLSSAAVSAIAATSALKSWDERNHEELEKLVQLGKYQAAALLQIAKNTQVLAEGGGLTNLVNMLNNLDSRT